MLKSYKDLRVWQKSIELVTFIYNLSKSFPKDETFGLTSQLRRAIVSVSLNIAEGYGRHSTQSYIQFLRIARGSIMESETCIIIAENLGYITNIQALEGKRKIEEVLILLNSLIKSLNEKLNLPSESKS
jgi:four helix bundle protein